MLKSGKMENGFPFKKETRNQLANNSLSGKLCEIESVVGVAFWPNFLIDTREQQLISNRFLPFFLMLDYGQVFLSPSFSTNNFNCLFLAKLEAEKSNSSTVSQNCKLFLNFFVVLALGQVKKFFFCIVVLI